MPADIIGTKSLRLFLGAALITAIAAMSCASDQLPTAALAMGGRTLTVEIADDPAERARGLMYRESLPEDHGMLFVFDYDQELSFWMKNTTIPLSIAFISSQGVILEIHDLEPLSERSVRSSRSARYALEVNRGLFERWEIEAGDRIDLPASVR